MRYGVVFPQTEFGNDLQAIKDYPQTAEGPSGGTSLEGLRPHPGHV